VLTLIIILEVAVWLAGLALLGAIFTGRLKVGAASLAAWNVSVEDFALCLLLVVGGGLAMPHVVTHLGNEVLGPSASDGDWWFVVQGAAFQLGLLGGASLAALYLSIRRKPAPAAALSDDLAPPPAPVRNPLFPGIATFVIAIPVISAIGLMWKTIINTLGLSIDEQDMVGMFRDVADPARWAFMVVLAVVIAPVTEELVFRAGLFRYLHKRVPHTFALTLPALAFALLHGNLAAFLPLFALGVFFAVAYEQTGRIAVPMIAHALFNLHTILLVMAGVSA
jgi:membrane protease YdiL (CAAX protease family)